MKVAPKQEYRPPKFQVYGDLSHITKGSVQGSKNDHGGGNVKTQ